LSSAIVSTALVSDFHIFDFFLIQRVSNSKLTFL